jgi:hypothetical protein
MVAEKLQQEQWSPQQIAGWLKATYPNDPEMQVSHETIYRTLFIQSRGALRKELTKHLRTGRAIRRSAGTRLPDGRGGRPGILDISERPAEAADRAVPGHWEGDLVSQPRSPPCPPQSRPGCRRPNLQQDAACSGDRAHPFAEESSVPPGCGPVFLVSGEVDPQAIPSRPACARC